MTEAKATARAALLTARAGRTPEPDEDARRTAALVGLATATTTTATATGTGTVAAYASFGTEPSTLDALDAWLGHGLRVLLPVVLPGFALEFRRYDGALVTGRGGMACPPPSAPVVPLREASLVVVPALACDRAGRRLGRGRGSYDRVLPDVDPRALTVAVVYPEELWETVPVEEHDQRVRAVLAGDELVRCG